MVLCRSKCFICIYKCKKSISVFMVWNSLSSYWNPSTEVLFHPKFSQIQLSAISSDFCSWFMYSSLSSRLSCHSEVRHGLRILVFLNSSQGCMHCLLFLLGILFSENYPTFLNNCLSQKFHLRYIVNWKSLPHTGYFRLENFTVD